MAAGSGVVVGYGLRPCLPAGAAGQSGLAHCGCGAIAVTAEELPDNGGGDCRQRGTMSRMARRLKRAADARPMCRATGPSHQERCHPRSRSRRGTTRGFTGWSLRRASPRGLAGLVPNNGSGRACSPPATLHDSKVNGLARGLRPALADRLARPGPRYGWRMAEAVVPTDTDGCRTRSGPGSRDGTGALRSLPAWSHPPQPDPSASRRLPGLTPGWPPGLLVGWETSRGPGATTGRVSGRHRFSAQRSASSDSGRPPGRASDRPSGRALGCPSAALASRGGAAPVGRATRQRSARGGALVGRGGAAPIGSTGGAALSAGAARQRSAPEAERHSSAGRRTALARGEAAACSPGATVIPRAPRPPRAGDESQLVPVPDVPVGPTTSRGSTSGSVGPASCRARCRGLARIEPADSRPANPSSRCRARLRRTRAEPQAPALLVRRGRLPAGGVASRIHDAASRIDDAASASTMLRSNQPIDPIGSPKTPGRTSAGVAWRSGRQLRAEHRAPRQSSTTAFRCSGKTRSASCTKAAPPACHDIDLAGIVGADDGHGHPGREERFACRRRCYR
jgi:hypothetical protein